MAIEIKEDRGVYELHGSLTTQNITAIRTYFLLILENHTDVVVNVEHLDLIDVSALNFLKDLPAEALGMNRNLTLVGLEFPEWEARRREIDQQNPR